MNAIDLAGPLAVSARNPRHFEHRSGPGAGRAVYLTGSHIWNNLHDGLGSGAEGPAEPERFDFDGYLRFLTERGHNFIRLWRWEQFRSQAAGGSFHLNMAPQPWARTGPTLAKDGKPRFDLERFDDSFFQRLRDRVIAARDAGIYVGVMLFDGWALHLSPAPEHIEDHPSWVSSQGPDRGVARVYVDGVYRQDVDLYAASNSWKRVVFAASWSTVGTHTIEIRNKTSKRIDVDAFVLFR
jgi:hypothetical protein